jgi:hypothetical protein
MVKTMPEAKAAKRLLLCGQKQGSELGILRTGLIGRFSVPHGKILRVKSATMNAQHFY